jgi:hypothetical protein
MLFSFLFCLLGRGSVYTVLNSIKCIFRVFGCMSLGFIARGYGLAAPSARLPQATLLALLAVLVWYVFVGFCLGRGCWVGVITIAFGLLNFLCCSA